MILKLGMKHQAMELYKVISFILYFYFAGLIKFFGCVARLHPKEVFSTNKTFVNAVFNNLTNPESETLHSLSVQTLGFIGSSVEGKLALEKLGTFTCLILL